MIWAIVWRLVWMLVGVGSGVALMYVTSRLAEDSERPRWQTNALIVIAAFAWAMLLGYSTRIFLF